MLIPNVYAQQIGGEIEPVGGFAPESVTEAGSTLEQFFTNLFGFFTVLAGLMFIVYFAMGSLKWITSGGDTAKVDEAKKQMTNAAIGLIIVVAAYAITYIVGQVLGLNILNPNIVIQTLYPQ